MVGVLVNFLNDAVSVFELIDGVLKLTIKYEPIGDDNHFVEGLTVLDVVQIGETVTYPCDGIGLARTGGVLDKVVLARPARLRVGLELFNCVPLVEAREDRRSILCLSGLGSLLRRVHVNEACENVEPRVTLPHVLPEVSGAVANGRGWVSGPARLAGTTSPLVEW